MLHLLAISGSLRAVSSNTSLLQATALLAPAHIKITQYQGLDRLPHFNPDIENPLPASVLDLHTQIAHADGLLISCPEYARGIPGSFKNALDWLVGSLDFPGKPVAIFNASPRASEAQAALRLVLSTMSADIVEAASMTVPLLARGLDAQAIATEPEITPLIVAALSAFEQHIRTQPVPDGAR